MSTLTDRLGRSLVATLAAALTLPGAALAQDRDERDRDDRGGDRGDRGGDRGGRGDEFATIKDGNKLVVFSGENRGNRRGRDGESSARRFTIRGIAADERIVGIDVRPTGPQAGGLYGVGSANNVYLINPRNGQARRVSTLTTPLNGNSFGVDFNPVVDRLRIISDNDQNLRANVDTGMTTVDGPLAYAMGDRNQGTNPAATGAGYTYAPFSTQMPPPVATTLYDIETAADFLVVQNPPNNGTLNSRGALGRDVRAPGVGFDIAGKRDFEAYGFFREGGGSKLYRVSLGSGSTRYTGVSLAGSYDGLAVLNGYGGR